MAYSEDDKDTTQSMKRIYKGIADGTYTPAQELPQTLRGFAEMEAETLQETKEEITSMLAGGSGSGRYTIPELMSQASSAIEGLDEIVHIRRDQSKGKF